MRGSVLKRGLCLLIILACLPLAGCWSSHEVNTLAICSALGIDKTADGYLVTEQVINPKAVASTKAMNQAPVVVYDGAGESIDGAINYLLLKASRLIYNTHLRMVVFGEDVAREGIGEFFNYFMRSYEYRTDFFCAVAKGSSAKDILCTLTPLESIPAVELFTMLKRSSEEIGVTRAMKVIDLVNSLSSEGVNPVLTGVEISREGEKSNDIDVLKLSENFEKLKFCGLAAFKGDRLAGWLTEEESKGYGYIAGKIKGSLEIVRCGEKSEINCNILSSKAKIKADTAGGKPSVAVEIAVKYAVSGTKGGFDITEKQNIKRMNRALENKIKRICAAALSKAQGKLQTDIFGFGEAVHRKDPSYWNAVKDDWEGVYRSMPVRVGVKAELVSIGEITKPVYSSKKG